MIFIGHHFRSLVFEKIMVSGMRMTDLIKGRTIRVRGLVQGVGFRPTVWRLAKDRGFDGDVLNDGAGVLIRAWGGADELENFITVLREQAPPLSRIDTIEWEHLESNPQVSGFHIAASVSDVAQTGVVPDAATCATCRDEIADPKNRRFRYPFTNCTHCGPRLSIIEAIPYDRARTSMSAFDMCPACWREYGDPDDRRFHAQPNACPACGPRVWLEGPGAERSNTCGHQDVLVTAAELIRQGGIVAIKGIGGFHLACDAANAEAVAELRRRKHRYAKPFAVMAQDVDMVAQYVTVTDLERIVLGSPEAPIVVLDQRPGMLALADEVAPGQDALGFMLPYTPLHHILMSDLGRPIVLTSGNRSDEPQAISNSEARERLAGIADAWLMHDRDIVTRLDDSVIRVVGGEARILRRARGFAPTPVPLPDGFDSAPDVLAMGGQLKNTFCLIKNAQAIVSQHMGNQENPRAHADFCRNTELYRELNQFTPEIIAVDQHPDYMPTKWGDALADSLGVPVDRVQHHHAHVASVMAEHGLALESGPVLGIVLDGLGYGTDGELWGGEFMVADYMGSRRVAHFDAVPLIGGTKAMLQPWRNTFAHVEKAFGWAVIKKEFDDLDLVRRLAAKPVTQLGQMLARGINVPTASSAGRLFDAVAAALGICFEEIRYEGEAAIMLENLALQTSDGGEHYPAEAGEVIEWRGLWHGVLVDLKQRVAPATIARKFHNTVVHAVSATARRILKAERCEYVVLTGGVFQNRILLRGVIDSLRAQGIRTLSPSAFPANDGGLALGQAVIAAARNRLTRGKGIARQNVSE